MNEDIQRELLRLGERDREAQRSRGALTAAWRRLRSLRDGLARELDTGMAGMTLRETDPDRIYAGMYASYKAGVEAAIHESAAANARLEEHVASAGPMAWLRAVWREERTRLAAEASDRRKAAEALISDLPNKAVEFKARAQTLAAENRRVNERNTRPLAPLRERLSVLDTALAAVEAGDVPSCSCLLRWDLPLLERISRIWKRIQDDGFVSDEDYYFYRSAARMPADASGQEDNARNRVLIRRTVEEIIVLPNAEDGRTGPIVDADYHEVKPAGQRAIPYRPDDPERRGNP